MSNPLIDIMKEGSERNWCMTLYCTTCGSKEYRKKLKELAGPLGGPLANALSEIDIKELTAIPNWQDALLIAINDLPPSMQVEGVLKAWLPGIANNIRFADYILFKLVKYMDRNSETRTDWINSCIDVAIETKDFSLTESLVLVLGQNSKEHSELISTAKKLVTSSAQMKRVLRNVCNINV